MNNRVSQGKTYKEKMAKLDEEILRLEDELEKLLAKKRASQMSANSGEFLYSNLRLAMQYIDQSPPEAQKAMIASLIKGIIVYEDHIELKMYIDQPTADSVSYNLPASQIQKTTENEKCPTEACKALVTAPTARGSSERQGWLPS